uniref:Putative salivary secreted peptide n=1 Tax=Ixodes ricinus TaxID=34613 RepID=A0A6B0UZ66_IXORI
MPPIVPLVLWTSTLFAASSLLPVTSNSTTQGAIGGKHKVYNACSIVPGGNYYADPEARNTSAGRYLHEYCIAHHNNLQTRVSGRALKDNKCCRVCCNVTVDFSPYATHYLYDQKAPYGFPCGENKICNQDQLCIPKPNKTIERNETVEPDWKNYVNYTVWVSGPPTDYTNK